MGKLELIRNIYHERGTTTGRLGDTTGCVCVLGAVALAYDINIDDYFFDNDAFATGKDDDVYEKLDSLLETDEEAKVLVRAVAELMEEGFDGYILELSPSTYLYRYNDFNNGNVEVLDALIEKAIQLRDNS